MRLCKGCVINPRTGRCQFDGPYRMVPARKLDVGKYIGEVYGTAEPPRIVNNRAIPQWKPFPQTYPAWNDYLQMLKDRR